MAQFPNVASRYIGGKGRYPADIYTYDIMDIIFSFHDVVNCFSNYFGYGLFIMNGGVI